MSQPAEVLASENDAATPRVREVLPGMENHPPLGELVDCEVPADQSEFLQLNAELAAIWPNITKKKDSLSDAEQWNNVPGKRKLLER